MRIDIYTLVIILVLGCCMQVIVMYWQMKLNENIPAIRSWMWTQIFLAISVASVFARSFINFDFFTIMVANALLLISELFRYHGVCLILEKRPNRILIQVLLLAYVLLFGYFTYIKNLITVRVAIISLLLSIVSLFMARDLMTSKKKSINVSAKLLGGLTACYTVFHLLRILSMPLAQNNGSFFDPTISQPLYLLTIFVVGFMWTIGALIIISQLNYAELIQAQERFQTFFQISPDFSFITELESGIIIEVNDGFLRAAEFTREEVINNTILNLNIWSNMNDRDRFISMIEQTGNCHNLDMEARSKSGKIIHTLISSKIMILNGKSYLMNVARDITDRKFFEEKIEVLSRAVEQSSVAIVILSKNRHIEYVNERYSQLSGYSSEELLGLELNWSFLNHNVLEKYHNMWETVEHGDSWSGEFYLQKKDGNHYWESVSLSPIINESDVIQKYVAVIEDVSKRKFLEQQLQKQATTDALTNLHNRGHFISCMQKKLANSDALQSNHIFLIFDLDLFKQVNDTYGHVVGDKALALVADVCRSAIYSEDIIGRIGGEEFAVFLPNTNLTDGIAVAQRLRIRVEEANLIDLQGRKIQLTISVGVTNYKAGDSFQRMLCRADNALYQAKESGRNRVCVIDVNQDDISGCELLPPYDASVDDYV